MKVGFVLPHIGWTAGVGMIVRVAQQAEAAGADALWVTDCLLSPIAPQTPYPGSPTGELPTAYTRVYDPLSVLAFVATYTTGVTLGTCVLNIPFYEPAVLARQLATSDQLSAGRLRVGLGLGWSRDEFVAVGEMMQQRGRRCEECVQVLNAVWTEEIVAFNGDFSTIPPSVIAETGAAAAPTDLSVQLRRRRPGACGGQCRRVDKHRRAGAPPGDDDPAASSTSGSCAARSTIDAGFLVVTAERAAIANNDQVLAIWKIPPDLARDNQAMM